MNPLVSFVESVTRNGGTKWSKLTDCDSSTDIAWRTAAGLMISEHRFKTEGDTIRTMMDTIAKTKRTKTAMGTGLVDKALLDAGFHSFFVLPAIFFVELRCHRIGRRLRAGVDIFWTGSLYEKANQGL
uniref:Uncharacterized protein n=1 Tax=Anopheles coluzzii TaxID=1518534 RepID=A0A8W7PN99_ANOCL